MEWSQKLHEFFLIDAALKEAHLTCTVGPLGKFLTFHLFLHFTFVQLSMASGLTFPNFT